MKKEKSKVLAKKKESLVDAFKKFSKTNKDSDFDAAMKIRTDLIENENQSEQSLAKIKINTYDLFKKSFQFPEVAKNDFSTEVLEDVEIAEKNLNANLDNVDLYNAFIDTTEKAAKKLKGKYADQWSNPTQGEEVQKVEESED